MIVLKTDNLTKTYKKVNAVDHVSMTINKGDIYGFVGTNGAGKTTLMRLILTLATPSEGSIELFESKDILKQTARIGSLIETPALYMGCTAYENLRRYAVLYGADESKIYEILELVGLRETGRKTAGNFSLGMKQRLGIAIALLGDPEFMVLDEPVNGLDPVGITEIRNLILKLNQEKGITFLISSHLLDELSKIANKIGIINKGKLLEETTFEQIEKECQGKIIVKTDDNEKAVNLIKENFSEIVLKISESDITIINGAVSTATINKMLVEAGIGVEAIYPEKISLEQFYIEKVGALVE